MKELDRIYDASGVRTAVLLCYRKCEIPDTAAENKAQDTMFAVVKHLHSLSEDLKEACQSRELRSRKEVLSLAAIRVGQVSSF